MNPEIVSVNLDSLYLSIHGELNEFAESIIPAAKQQAQDDDEDLFPLPEFPGIPGGRFFVSRKGASRDYPYVLQNARFRVNMTRRGGSRPVLTVQVKSDSLYEYNLEAIDVAIERLCGALLATVDRVTVSRADIAVDFQQSGWRYPEMADCNTRARSRFVHYEGKNVTGMTFGRHQGTMQVQIYTKSETLKSDGKQWMKRVWAAGGNYDEDLPVYRVEVRFYREILRELRTPDGVSIGGVADLDASLRDLVSYAVSGRKPFFRVVDELYRLSGLHGAHSERQDDASWWETVKSAFARLDGSQARKRVADEVRYVYTAAVSRAAGALATAAAIARSQGWHPAFNVGAFARDSLTGFFAEEASLWPEMVNQRLERLRTKVGPERVVAA